MPSRSLEVDSMDDTDAPQGGEEHAPVADMGGLSALSAAAFKRILEDGDPDLQLVILVASYYFEYSKDFVQQKYLIINT